MIFKMFFLNQNFTAVTFVSFSLVVQLLLLLLFSFTDNFMTH